MEDKLKITFDEINNIENFNLPLLQEAMRQVELKVQDENNRKERIDQRVYSLLTLCLGIVGIIVGSITTQYIQLNTTIFFIVNITGILFLVTLYFLFKALKSKTYSTLGTYPHSWLTKDYIKDYDKIEKNNAYILGIALARILFAFEKNITASDKSNSDRIKTLNLSLNFCQSTLLPFLGFFTVNLIPYLHFILSTFLYHLL